MSPTGLSPREIELIAGVFRNRPGVTRVDLFGSRARGRFKPGSDVDLALRGNLDPLQAELIALDLDELPLPYKFDVLTYDSINVPELRDEIDREGVAIYVSQ